MQTLEDANEPSVAQEDRMNAGQPVHASCMRDSIRSRASYRRPWTVYYLACAKKPYERNLMKNHSGAEYSDHWDIIWESGYGRMVEEPPAGMPELPQTKPLFKDRRICFTTSYFYCTKVQGIILTNEGIHSYILDTLSTTYRGIAKFYVMEIIYRNYI
ncbi:uncharacterized protein LOC112465643 [Temnothorax curvispinosus]|uniref:Uncharacterized protein LOC112465643 n=1 Tax=Temnothorax curvispinosus TaxID=300111 RepID=A0A6J1R7Y5_9HYME|nr:uncharacterized protein LOC112465643 [Temnothorax curvispinosus]